MSFSLNVISNPKELVSICRDWDDFVSQYSDNPFVLCKFMELYTKLSLSRWRLCIIIGKLNNTLVGIAPLKIRQKFGVRVATFIISPENSVDFITREQYNIEFLRCVVNYLFEILKCNVVDLTFLSESHNLHIFQELCRAKQIKLFTQPFTGRRILKVGCTWEQFEKLKGSHFRRTFKRMENRLSKAGCYRVLCFDEATIMADVFQRILEIERLSWKESWRAKRKMRFDTDLLITWLAATQIYKINPNFKIKVWFLELNNHLIAYAIVFLYKQVAVIVKTSYDARYKQYYPGMYLIHSIIQSIFKSGAAKIVDFMTDMEIMKNWTDLCLGRVRIIATKQRFYQLLMRAYCRNLLLRLLWSKIGYYLL